MPTFLCSPICVFVVVVMLTGTSIAVPGSDASSSLIANGDNVARTLLNLDRLYSKRYQEYELPSGKTLFTSPDRRIDGLLKPGQDISTYKQAYKIIMLDDLDRRYAPIYRPRIVV